MKIGKEESFIFALLCYRVTDVRLTENDIRKSLSKTYVYRLGVLPFAADKTDFEASEMDIMTYKTIGYVQ